MQIEAGLHTHGVLQRDTNGRCDVDITGSCNREGKVLVTVSQDGAPLDAFMAEQIGTALDGRFSARLQGLEVGGPYSIQLSITSATGKWVDSITVDDVLVGDLWLLGGQSNMQGVGLLADAPEPDPLVRAHFLDGCWDIARESLHNMHLAEDAVHRIISGGALPAPMTTTGVGPGHAFGLELLRQRQVPQGLIAAAHGGTTMTQWDPSRRDEGPNSLYGAMIDRLRRNGGRVAGMIWYQGESDANVNAAPHYTQRMIDLIAALRRDAADPALPVVVVQISRVIGWPEEIAGHWNAIQDQQRRLPERIDQLAVVPSIDFTLDDAIHISGTGQCILGRRLAEAMQTLTASPQALPPPIELDNIRIDSSERGMADIHVSFRHVAGHLQAASRPTGFRLTSGDRIFDTRLQGHTAILRTGMTPFQAETGELHYGWHTNPYCNIVDTAGRSLPVFGPVQVGAPRAISPPVRRMLVSPILPGHGNLANLARPDWSELDLVPRDFIADFCDRHGELSTVGTDDGVVYYALCLRVEQPMPITLLVGYDGPVKVWLADQEIFHDPAGTNPATPEKARIKVELTAGEHPLLIALGANLGRAWGIFLHLMREDLTSEQIQAHDYALPSVEL